jgi:hypothetical protein
VSCKQADYSVFFLLHMQYIHAGYYDAKDLGAALTQAQSLIAQIPLLECAVISGAGDPSGVQQPLRDLLDEEEDCVRRVLPARFFDTHSEDVHSSSEQSPGDSSAVAAAQRCLRRCARFIQGAGEGNINESSDSDTLETLDPALVGVIQTSSKCHGSGAIQGTYMCTTRAKPSYFECAALAIHGN